MNPYLTAAHIVISTIMISVPTWQRISLSNIVESLATMCAQCAQCAQCALWPGARANLHRLPRLVDGGARGGGVLRGHLERRPCHRRLDEGRQGGEGAAHEAPDHGLRQQGNVK